MIEVPSFPLKSVQRAYERLTLPRAIINVVLIISDKLPEIVTYFICHMVHNDDNRVPVEGGELCGCIEKGYRSSVHTALARACWRQSALVPTKVLSKCY